MLSPTEALDLCKSERERMWDCLYVCVLGEVADGALRKDKRAARVLATAYAQELHDLGYRPTHRTGVRKSRRWRWPDDPVRADPIDWARTLEGRVEHRVLASQQLTGPDTASDFRAWCDSEAERIAAVRERLNEFVSYTNRNRKPDKFKGGTPRRTANAMGRLLAAYARTEDPFT